MIIKKNAIDFDKISDLIKEGSIFCYPTDTLYGLGCRYDNKTSIEKIISLKGREKNHFFILLFKDSKMLNNFFSISELEKNIINKFLPGKLSILLTPKDKNMFYNIHKMGPISKQPELSEPKSDDSIQQEFDQLSKRPENIENDEDNVDNNKKMDEDEVDEHEQDEEFFSCSVSLLISFTSEGSLLSK